MKQLIYADAQVIRMTSEEVEKLGMLCPKFVYCQIESSGSPSAWTNYGEYLAGTKGSDIVRAAKEIRSSYEECAAYNDALDAWGTDGRRAIYAHIRVVF